MPKLTPDIVLAASFVIAIPALALMSPLTIVPSAIIVLVTEPVSPVVTIVPLTFGTVSVLVVLAEIPTSENTIFLLLVAVFWK